MTRELTLTSITSTIRIGDIVTHAGLETERGLIVSVLDGYHIRFRYDRRASRGWAKHVRRQKQKERR